MRAAGSWKRYAAEPRVQLVVLRKLAESGRAVATRGVATRLFAPRRRVQAMGSRALPDVLFWKILEFWRTDRNISRRRDMLYGTQRGGQMRHFRKDLKTATRLGAVLDPFKSIIYTSIRARARRFIFFYF